MYPKNKLDSNYKLIKAVKNINDNTPTPTPTGSNVHVYELEFNFENREEYEDGYYIDVDSNIKATILNDYQTYGQDHCYFAKIVLEGSSDNDFVMFAPISFYDLNNDPYPKVDYEFEDNTTCVYFYDDSIELDRYDSQAYKYTRVSIYGGTLDVYTDFASYQGGDAVKYLFDDIVNEYGVNTKLKFSNYDTNEYCMLTCNYKGNNDSPVVFTGKVANKPIALIIYNNDDEYGWKLIGNTLEVRAYNGGLVKGPFSTPVTYQDFYEELNLCYNNTIPFELELIVGSILINNASTALIFNKWNYIYDEANSRVHAVSTVIHPDGYVISVDILIEDSNSNVMYNIITL